MPKKTPLDLSTPVDGFVRRHIGPSDDDVADMLGALGLSTLEELVAQTIPPAIRQKRALDTGREHGEHELLLMLRNYADENQVAKSYLGMGYHDCITPPVIQRNILENPGWYTQYTPYQPEISQGRLEALLNYQTMVSDLTGMPVSNASMLDEATAAAEAMNMCRAVAGAKGSVFFIAEDTHPQTIAVVTARAQALGVVVKVGNAETAELAKLGAFGVLMSYPATDGRLFDPTAIIDKAHAAGALAVVATDLLALTLVKAPGELGADVAVGSAQRFGVPLGYGGPHAAFMATRDQHRRLLPGRIVGVSKDSRGAPALRLAMQTREQHIRREKATSNICTAQVLLANMASMYAVYHGPQGLKRIAERVHGLAKVLAAGAQKLGHKAAHASFFDTVRIEIARGGAKDVVTRAAERGVNLRELSDRAVVIALDETTTLGDVDVLLAILASGTTEVSAESLASGVTADFGGLARTSGYLAHPVFNAHHSETEMLRYMHRLEQKDLALNTAMIPLGSCTMKLNATAEMMPVTWPEFGKIHPFAPLAQTRGYQRLFGDLERMIAQMTGFHAVSLQPNAGSQGEYAGLLAIRRYHEERGQGHRKVCLIPQSAHGTNPASAVMAGMQVVVVRSDEQGSVDVGDLETKAEEHKEDLAALMITYPSTHGVFEEGISDICAIVHKRGGQVYMDGANLNAQVGLSKPGEIGADVCHLNLHKTFAIPHGGGGPGMGPIAVAKHLAPYLPGHPVVKVGGEKAIGPISAAPWGSASILTISWTYMMLMGGAGLTRATEVAILSANYMAKRLEPHYPILYRGKRGRVAHEFIIDLRPFKQFGIEVDDVAKRLMDYGFHAPTMSFPVAGTMMIEPTESEPVFELDRFCDAMITIREEIRAVEKGTWPKDNNPLVHAPHTALALTAAAWDRPYPRELGAFPTPFTRAHKYWPPVSRIDQAYGDRNFICTCPPVEEYAG
jgi:glycine dehydrogenase